MPDEAPGPTWRVISQQQTTKVTVDGRFQDVVEVTFETFDGDVGRVQIPVEAYGAEVARSMIEVYAAQLVAARRLEG